MLIVSDVRRRFSGCVLPRVQFGILLLRPAIKTVGIDLPPIDRKVAIAL
jgi:hypothetical protein